MHNILEDYFRECRKGEMGVMPYMEGEKSITFVWTNGKGYGRTAKIQLRKEGIKRAWELFQEIEKLNKESKPSQRTGDSK